MTVNKRIDQCGTEITTKFNGHDDDGMASFTIEEKKENVLHGLKCGQLIIPKEDGSVPVYDPKIICLHVGHPTNFACIECNCSNYKK